MKKVNWKLVQLLVIVLALVSCGDDGDQPLPSTNPPPTTANPVNILTINIGSSRFGPDSENWIFINTEDGLLMDVKQVANGQTVSFISDIDVPDFNVTWFQQKVSPNVNTPGLQEYFFQTYGLISKGSNLTWSNLPDAQPINPFSQGSASLSISNYFDSVDPKSAIGISNGFNPSLFSSEIEPTMFSNNIFTANIPLRFAQGSSDAEFFISAYRGGVPVYAFPKGIANGADVMLDFNDFLEFDHVINFNNTFSAGTIIGFFNSNGFINNTRRYLLSSTDFMFSTSSAGNLRSVGYNDGFDSYLTFLTGNGFIYNKLGSAPSTFQAPQQTSVVDVNSDNIQNFEFSTSESFIYYRAAWQRIRDQDIIVWTITGSNGSKFKITSVPSQIANKFPVLTLDLDFGSVRIVKYISDYTFADELDRIFLFKNPNEEEFFTLF